MFKKLLTLAAFMAVGVGWGNLAHAQTDVTATYITNPGFEGDQSSYSKPKSDRDIYQPNGWDISYTNGNENDLTSLGSSTTQWNQFSGKPQPSNGETKTYWMRFRWGSSENITLSQETATELLAGTYALSVDAYSDDNTGTVTISAAGVSQTVRTNGVWANYKVVFTLAKAQKVTVSLSYTNTASGEQVAAFDNCKLENITQGTSDLSENWTSTLANPGFELGTSGTYGSGQNVVNVPKGYTLSATMSGWRDGSISTTNPSEGSSLYNYWAGTTTALDIYQTVSLPVGKYTISADLRTQEGKISDQGVYAKIGETVHKSTTIQTIDDPWDSAEGWNTLSKDFYVEEDGTVQLGASSTGGANSVGWFQIDNFQLTYKGAVQNTPYSITSATATAVTADTWYAVEISADGNYRIISDAANTVYYTQNGYYAPSDVTESVTLSANEKQVVSLTQGTLYIRATTNATLTIEPDSYSYTISAATPNVADGAYVQSNTLTITFDASTNDPDGAFSILDATKIKVNNATATANLEGNVLTITLASTLATSTDYAVSIETGAIGYNADNANEAIDLTLHTPAVFDGTYYLYNDLTKRFIGRGMNWGTRTVVDKYGIAVNLATGTDGFTTIQFVDNNAYMKNTWWLYADGALADANTFKVIASTVEGAEGYHFATQQVSANLNEKKYLYVYTKDDNDKYACAGNSTMNENISDWKQTVWQLKTDAERDAIVDAYPTENISNVIAASGVETTAANFETYLSENYTAIDHTDRIGTATFSGSAGDWTWTGTDRTQGGQPAYGNGGFAEVWNATGTYTQTIAASELPAGIYKLTFQGYERRMANEASAALGNAGYNFVSSYVAANDEQVRFTDWYNVPDRPTNVNGALTAFANGYAKNEVFVYLDGETDLTIKVAKPNYIWDCWIIFNNFTLTYYKEASSIVPATGITIDPASATVTTGETVTLTATVTPEDADDKTASWSSSDETVATVDNNGVVTAHKAGEATITASANGGENITTTATITVADAPAPAFYATEIATATDYYIVNAATGKFLGGGNNYGTHASLIEHGIPFTITQEASGKYTLDSHVYNGKDSHYFKGDYVDQTSKDNIYITSIEGGRFSISTAESAEYVTAAAGNTIVANNAADAKNSLAQWYFVSKTDRDKALAAATDQNPVDATYYIPNASFSRNMNTQYNENPWSVDATNSNLNSETNCAESYHSTFEVKKTITNLPNGSYKVRAQAVANNAETGAVVFINESEDGQTAAFDVMQNGETNMATCAASFAAGRYYTEWIPVTVENHTLTLGVKGGVVDASWCVWDNFELYMTGYTPVTAVTASIDNSEIEVSKTAQIMASVTEGASFDAISYESSDVTVATVDENGLVTAVAEGTATITVKAEMENRSKTIDVTVIFTSATPDDYAALNAAMEGKILGFLEGEYAPYNNNVEGIEALNAAKAIDQTQKNSAEVVQSLTAAITNATWTANTEEVNAVYDGTFAAAENNGAPAGWTMSNNTLGGGTHARAFVGDDRLSEFNETKSGFFLRFDGYDSSRGSLYHYGKTAGYTMPLKANTTYYVKANVAGWGSTGKPIRLNVSGPEDFTALSQLLNTNVRADNADNLPQTFYILFTTGETEGNYTISFQTPGSDDNKHNVVVSNIELKSSLDVTMTIKVDNEYGTFFAPFDVDIPQGVKAYTVESVNDKDELVLIEVTSTIPANTPVIIYKNEFTAEEVANKVFTETFHGINLIANTETEGTNLLTGVYYRQLAPENSYVLQNIDEKVAFYHVEAGGQPAMRAYSAYLNYTEPNSAKSLSFGDDEATAIAGIEALTSGNMEGIYTTSGAKVNSLQKGVNIIRTKDGKSMKVYVK